MSLHKSCWLSFAFLLASIALIPLPSVASDHGDTAENYNRIGADMTDVFIFPSPVNDANVVLVMDVHGLIPAGQSPSFDPNVLYQIKIDTTGDFVEDLVIQTRFVGNGANQKVVMSGPYRPYTTGTTAVFAKPYRTMGTINSTFSPTAGMTAFAGIRSDPFFFDLDRFYAILPDRKTPLTGAQVDFATIMDANNPQMVNGFSGFRGFPENSGFDPSMPQDFLSNLNVLSIVVEMPRSMLVDLNSANTVIRLWETTSVATGAPNFNFVQQDRLARPAINEALAPVTNRRHEANNKDNPTDDSSQLEGDIRRFMAFPAGRSPAITNTLVTILVPDVMTADLKVTGTKASYLGFEAAKSFGGRDLKDDIVDTDLNAVFGNLLVMLGVDDDFAEKVQFTTDHVGPHTDFLGTFPYLGNPH